MVTATVELCESNESTGESITHGITNCNYGDTDAANLTPASYPISIPGYSYFKLWRIHCTALNDSTQLDNFKVYKSAGAYVTDEAIKTCLNTTQTPDYDGSRVTSYSTPDKSQYTGTYVTDMPTSQPGSANLGVGGSLTGSLTGAGYTDYIKTQKAIGSGAPPGPTNSLTLTFEWDEQ